MAPYVLGPDDALVMTGRWPTIDSERRPFGVVFWRFMLPEGDIETPQARVVPLAEVAQG